MKRRSHINFLTAIIFLGVICTFTVYFGMTALMSESGDLSVSERFSRAVYENESLSRIITEIDFRIFRRVENNNVIVGSDGFLFERADEKSGYEYLLDFRGELEFTDVELEIIKNNIEHRAGAYDNSGAEYILVIVPNSQTVYSEKMPFYHGKISENTRRAQLTRYLKENGIECVLDLTDDLIAAKELGQIYNNTENSLNALGAYAAYDAIVREMAERGIDVASTYKLEGSDFYSRKDPGLSIAGSAQIRHLAPNLTVSLRTDISLDHTATAEYENFLLTKSASNSGAAVLLEYNNEWNRIILQPYFSGTFKTAAYKANHMFSSFANAEAAPNAVIQIIGETELDTLLDSKTAMTYGAGYKNEAQHIMETEIPTVLGSVHLGGGTLCVFGTAERGANVYVGLAGEEPVRERAEDGRFFIKIDLPEGSDSAMIDISAKYGFKKQSEPLRIVLTRTESEVSGVLVGSNSFLFDKKYNIDGYADAEAAANAFDRAQHLGAIRDITGKSTEYLYALVPTKLTVSRDNAPELLQDTADKLAELRAILPSYVGDGVKTLDLTERMLLSKSNDLYLKTSNEPTDKGAYEIYCGIIEALQLPRIVGTDRLNILKELTPGGKLISSLGLDTTVVHEIRDIYTVRDSKVTLTFEGEADTTKKYISENEDKSLPTAIIIYDEYGADAVKYLLESFSVAVVNPQGDLWVTAGDLERICPDYIIRIVGED